VFNQPIFAQFAPGEGIPNSKLLGTVVARLSHIISTMSNKLPKKDCVWRDWFENRKVMSQNCSAKIIKQLSNHTVLNVGQQIHTNLNVRRKWCFAKAA